MLKNMYLILSTMIVMQKNKNMQDESNVWKDFMERKKREVLDVNVLWKEASYVIRKALDVKGEGQRKKSKNRKGWTKCVEEEHRSLANEGGALCWACRLMNISFLQH